MTIPTSHAMAPDRPGRYLLRNGDCVTLYRFSGLFWRCYEGQDFAWIRDGRDHAQLAAGAYDIIARAPSDQSWLLDQAEQCAMALEPEARTKLAVRLLNASQIKEQNP